MAWIYKLSEDYIWNSGRKQPKDLNFIDEHGILRMQILKNGQIVIKSGYVWDGCTFKFNIFDLIIIGTPDGVINFDNGKPKTYYASLIHDSLYQFMNDKKMPFSRKEMDKIFFELMVETNFKMRYVYYFAVRWFAWIWHHEDVKN